MKTTKENITEIRNIAKNMPKSLNEAIYEDFNEFQPGEEDPRKKMAVPAQQGPVVDGPQDDDEPAAPAEAPVEAPAVEAGAADMGAAGDMGEASDLENELGIQDFIANMRKQSLKIMAKLSDTPDNPVYEFAKKIFQLAEKAHQDEKEGKGIDGEPKQPEA